MSLTVDPDTMTLDEIVRLQTLLTATLQRRFERTLALVFTDVVGSTAYFARFGDQAGRVLQQRHLDLLHEVLPAADGRVVDTAGDGAFAVFPDAERAAVALCRLQTLIAAGNASFAREHRLAVRAGLHWGRVLSDGAVVTGDAVNLAARIAGSGEGGEVRLSRAAFQELARDSRLRCVPLPPLVLKGIAEPVAAVRLRWHQNRAVPTAVEVRETGERIALPGRDMIAFGRLREHNGLPANDVVLTLPDRELAQKISRWHFELHRRRDGLALRPISEQLTEVDGKTVARGAEAEVWCGTVVTLSRVLTLRFVGDEEAGGDFMTETSVG